MADNKLLKATLFASVLFSVILIAGCLKDTTPPRATIYPANGTTVGSESAEIKITFDESVTIINATLDSQDITLSSTDGKIYTYS